VLVLGDGPRRSAAIVCIAGHTQLQPVLLFFQRFFAFTQALLR
jgi:hypothetical protein